VSAVAGNHYDKYSTANPVARRLMAGFEAELDALARQAAPASLLDVGCGEGVLTERWARALAPVRVMGVDAADLGGEWAERPAAAFAVADAHALPFAGGEWDLVAAIELLEHVADPVGVLAELSRVARTHLLVSVPREPLWRTLNLARGAYVRDLGNTPGHRHHWSRRSFVELLERHGEVVQARSPLPWTMALVRL
jgi:ubiquinone/menaquinone biosynthesis C-methylase UbiE